MNRAEKRNLMKVGASKETVDELAKYNSPCTIAEAVQLARATAEDVVEGALNEYQRRNAPLQVAISLQVEIMKDVLIKSGMISEAEFLKRYQDEAERFNNLQKEQKEDQSPKMEVIVNDVEVKTED